MSTGLHRERSNIPNDPEDWLWSDEELQEAEKYLEEEISVDSSYDIPYTAGYSKDGKTVYVDSKVPHFIKVRRIKTRTELVEIDLYKTFAFHETVEKSLEAEPYFLPYQLAHQIALRSERMYVQSLGADWNDYNDKTLKIVNEVGGRDEYPNCPDDLDIEPLVDEDDDETLKKMRSRGGRDFLAEEDADEGESDEQEARGSGAGVEDRTGQGTGTEEEDEE